MVILTTSEKQFTTWKRSLNWWRHLNKMTTVVVDRKNLMMGADRKSVSSNNFQFRCAPKISRAVGKNGVEWLYATAGCSEAGSTFDDWFLAKIKENPEQCFPYPENGDFNALVINNLGQIYLYASKGRAILVKGNYMAIGSGGDYALGALYAGVAIPNAIRIASKLDPCSGFGVQCEILKPYTQTRKHGR